MTQLGKDIIDATLGNAQTLLLVPASCRPGLEPAIGISPQAAWLLDRIAA